MVLLQGEKTVVSKGSRCIFMNPVKRNYPESTTLKNLSNQYPDGEYKRIIMASFRNFCEVQFSDGKIINPPYEGT